MERAYRLFGDRPHISGYENAIWNERRIIEVHIQDVAHLPSHLVERVVEAGLAGVFIGTGRVADLDDLGSLRPFAEYADVAGVYDRASKLIVVGTRGVDPDDVPHNLWHEFGHAVGDLLQYNHRSEVHTLHANPEFWPRLHPSFRGQSPGSPLGIREMFAESVRDRLLDRDRAVRIYGSAYLAWLDEELDL